MIEIKIFIILILLLYICNKKEKFVSDDTIKKIENNRDLFSSDVPYKKALRSICGGKKCMDVVDHYKITELYSDNPKYVNEFNLKKELNY